MQNWIASLVSGGVKDVAEGIGGLAIDLRTAISGKDPIQKGELEKFTRELEALAGVAQTEVNKIEAAHHSIFVAGWRPAVGWICAFGLAYHYILFPTLVWYTAIWHPDVSPPMLTGVADLLTLLAGMLGFGVLRSWEKKHSIQNRH